MRISELARETGVPLATVKFYLREGLVPAGRATSATQAEYDATHVRRLRLVRALVEIGGLPLAAVRDVLVAVDAGPDLSMTAIGTAHAALPPCPPPGTGTERALAVVESFGWSGAGQTNALGRLQAALEAMDAVGLAPDPDRLRTYADAALTVAAADVSDVPAGPVADVVEYIVVGTVLYEPLLLALRRIAQQHLFVTRRPEG
ncbi:MerR family transcriptional regulator [Kineosporia sp. A_224]|uniref:MerR family transcriptional regulator n=1 Tax=Kineosporia sp. A_224 TaxID=1962180 RepID=UPI0013043D4C|nr:MerR family transcriptional regulator [Kineosporia sp. A_224]